MDCSSRRGMIIPMAVFIIGILAVLVSVFNLSSRQSKLMSRRIFWGEITYFLAESILEETFHEISTNPEPYIQSMRESSGAYVDLGYRPTALEELNTGYGLGLGAGDVRLEGKFIPTAVGGEDLELEGDLVGVMQITVTVKVTAQRIRSKALIRRISANRGIRYVRGGGQRFLTPYLLFLKNPPQSPSKGSVSDINLRLKRTSTEMGYGRIFLGGAEDTQHHVNPYRILPGSAQENYLNSWEMRAWEQLEISSIEAFEGTFERDRNRVLMDLIWWDPRFRRITGRGTVDPMIGENRALGWLRSYFQAVPSPVIEFRMDEDFSARSDTWNLQVESASGAGLPVEGKVFQKFLFHTTAIYPPGGKELEPQSSTYLANHRVPLAQLYESEPLRTFAGWKLFGGMEVFQGKEENTRLSYAPFMEVKTYSEIYPKFGTTSPWDHFQSEHIFDFQDRSLLRVNGISGIIGDLQIDRPTTYTGKGVIIVMGKVIISAPLTRDPTDPDAYLMIVSRAKTGFTEPVQINTPETIEAYIQAHSFASSSSKRGTLKASVPFHIRGGLSLDYLDVNSLPTGSVLETDPVAYGEVRISTLQKGYQFYKVFNNERPEASP